MKTETKVVTALPSPIQEFDGESVYIDSDPHHHGKLCLRRCIDAKVVAEKGEIDSYSLCQMPDGTLGGSFSYKGFRRVEEPPSLDHLTGVFEFFGFPCRLVSDAENKMNLTHNIGGREDVIQDVVVGSFEVSCTRGGCVEVANLVLEFPMGGSLQIARANFAKG